MIIVRVSNRVSTIIFIFSFLVEVRRGGCSFVPYCVYVLVGFAGVNRVGDEGVIMGVLRDEGVMEVFLDEWVIWVLRELDDGVGRSVATDQTEASLASRL